MLLKRTAFALALMLAAATCSDDDMVAPTTASNAPVVEAGAEFPSQRCEDNKAAGKITYLSGFDFAASASIVDVLVAKQKGYFEALCLDVEVLASFSTENYPLIAGNQAQFASGGSFSEVVAFRADNADADVVALAVEGRTAIDSLIIKPGEGTTLAELEGATIGVKGRIPPSIKAMLAKAGLVEGTDYQTVPVEGFDPTVHIAIPEIVGFPGYKSAEPGRLDREGIPYTLFDPSQNEVPGSFGVLFTNRTFMTDHPTATEDFMRATMQGLADAIADPAGSAMIAVDFIDNNGNPNFLSPDSEMFRWETESKLVFDNTPEGQAIGLPDGDQLEAEVTAYAEIGLFGGVAPDISKAYDASVLTSIYDGSGTVVWPST